MKRVAAVVSVSVSIVLQSSSGARATFPGTNGLIVFYNYAGLPEQIFTIRADGTGKTQLTATTTRTFNEEPAWSADGTKIAYVGLSKHNHLKVMNADGSGATRLLTSPAAPGFKYLFDPAWSPDGTMIAYCADGSAGDSVFIIGSDGTGNHSISGTHQDCSPDWSPDGTMIAVDTSGRHFSGKQITILSADGSTRTPVITGGYNSTPSWSPDGTHIVFRRQLGGSRSDIYTMNADGSGVTQITDTPNRWEFAPAYSPDGLLVVFSRTQGNDLYDRDDLWVANADGTSRVRITATPRVDEYGVDWQAT